jgi:hypothetical protein
MSTFEDYAAIDLFPDVDPEPVLGALTVDGKGAAWVDTLSDGRARIGLHLTAGDANLLIEPLFEVVGDRIARILVEANYDEHGLEHVVLANRDGRLVRTQHIHVEPRTNGVPDSLIELILDPPSDLFDDLPAEVRADPTTIPNHPELRHMLRSDGTFAYPVDEGLVNESENLDAVLDGPLARVRTTELYGVAAGALDTYPDPELCDTNPFSSWWKALGVDMGFMDGEPHRTFGR